jgi:hypothetical protein
LDAIKLTAQKIEVLDKKMTKLFEEKEMIFKHCHVFLFQLQLNAGMFGCKSSPQKLKIIYFKNLVRHAGRERNRLRKKQRQTVRDRE